jgi:hypothetical protein
VRHYDDHGAGAAEHLVTRVIRPASALVALCSIGAGVTSLGALPARGAVVALVAALVAAVGATWRTVRARRRWGLPSAAVSAGCGLALSTASGGLDSPVSVVLVLGGVLVSLALALSIIVAASARRDRRRPTSRL